MADNASNLARAALTVDEAWLALGSETFIADGATFVRNRSAPAARGANHVAHVTVSAPDDIDRLCARVQREFAGYPYRTFNVDFTTPPQFEARLVLEGYQTEPALLMVLEGDLRGGAKPHDVRPIVDEKGWRALVNLQTEDDQNSMVVARVLRSKCPPVRYWLAHVDGEAAGYLSSWSGLDGVGLVENLYVAARFRHRGVATALVHRCVAGARERGAGPVVIDCDPVETPKHMYAAMGFRPIALKRSYSRSA